MTQHETEHLDTATDNLSLTVINDGQGEQCGYSYDARCAIFIKGTSEPDLALAALRMVNRANEWMKKRGYAGADALLLLNQAWRVVEYYSEHVVGMEAG